MKIRPEFVSYKMRLLRQNQESDVPFLVFLIQQVSGYKKQKFSLRPKNVSYNTRLSGNEGQCFLHEGSKLIAFHMSLQCLSTLI